MSRSPLVLRAVGAPVLALTCCVPLTAEEPLSADRFAEIVLRSHPGARRAAGLEGAAEAERKAARLFPDPSFQYTQDRARLADAPGATATERGYSVSQTIPWPGRFRAGIRAGDRAAESLRGAAEEARWELTVEARTAFFRLGSARALLEIARAAEQDARSLRDLLTRRAELGESRESDRIKATVEWLRQQRNLAAAEREAEAAEAILRALAVEPLPKPLAIAAVVHEPLPALDREALAAQISDRSPRLRAARAEAQRQQALLSVARRARIPDLDVTVFRQKELDKQATGFGLGVTLPLWNANRGEIARADAASRISSAEAERARIALATELPASLKELQIAGDQASLLDREILPAAQRSVELVRLSFEEGETSLLDLLDAQRTFRDTQREAAEAHLALSLALGEVQKLAGPDFNPWR